MNLSPSSFVSCKVTKVKVPHKVISHHNPYRFPEANWKKKIDNCNFLCTELNIACKILVLDFHEMTKHKIEDYFIVEKIDELSQDKIFTP